MRIEHDWEAVVARRPVGYLELNDGKRVLNGPVKAIQIHDQHVVVILEKTRFLELDENHLPCPPWIEIKNTPLGWLKATPFVYEDTPKKGPRIRFGLNILYFEKKSLSEW